MRGLIRILTVSGKSSFLFDFFSQMRYNIKMEKTLITGELMMKHFARSFASRLKGGEVIDLIGEMGAGKTVFAKGLAEGLGVLQIVTSPTFSIMNEYDGKTLKMYHFDFYRIIDPSEAEELGLTEHFGDFDAVCVVEWGRNVADYIPKNAIKIEIRKLSNTEREVTIL